VLPLCWLRSHRRDVLEHNQKCKVCGQSDRIDFHVPDETWNAIVPLRYRNRVVCLKCFDCFACAIGYDYKSDIDYMCFAGDECAFGLKITRP